MSIHTLHLGVMPVSGQASFMGWRDTRRELVVAGLTHPHYPTTDDAPVWEVRVSGSWEVWGTADQAGHRSLHLEVEVDSLDPVDLNEVVHVIQQWITGRIVDTALITSSEDHSRKTHVVDLSARPTVYVYELDRPPF